MEQDFETALNVFVEKLQSHIVEETKRNFPALEADKIELEFGKKFIRVVCRRSNGSRHAHSFVSLKDSITKSLGTVKRGDVLKPATWKAPAKHARGTIFTEDFRGYGVNAYGANYLP